MTKHKELAITQHASLAAKALSRLETAAREVHESETAKRDRNLQLISTKDQFSAIIRHGKTIVEISGSDFAVTQMD